MSRQPTLFDMAMRDKLETVTWGYQALQRDLEQARAHIQGLEDANQRLTQENQRLTQRIHALATEAR